QIVFQLADTRGGHQWIIATCGHIRQVAVLGRMFRPFVANAVRRNTERIADDESRAQDHRRRYSECVTLGSRGVPCTVIFTGPSGIRHSVGVTAKSVYEAAALGVS